MIVWNQAKQHQDSDKQKYLMGTKGTNKSLGPCHAAYNFWNTCFNNTYPYKYDLEKVKHLFCLTMFPCNSSIITYSPTLTTSITTIFIRWKNKSFLIFQDSLLESSRTVSGIKDIIQFWEGKNPKVVRRFEYLR